MACRNRFLNLINNAIDAAKARAVIAVWFFQNRRGKNCCRNIGQRKGQKILNRKYSSSFLSYNPSMRNPVRRSVHLHDHGAFEWND